MPPCGADPHFPSWFIMNLLPAILCFDRSDLIKASDFAWMKTSGEQEHTIWLWSDARLSPGQKVWSDLQEENASVIG